MNLYLERIAEILVDLDNGKTNDRRAIEKIMRVITKYQQSKSKEKIQ